MARTNTLKISMEDDLYDAIAEEAEETGRGLAAVIRDHLRRSIFGEEITTGRVGVGDLAQQLIREGLPNDVVLERVREEFPDAQTSPASISWYRSDLKRSGERVLSQVEARRRWAERS